MLTGLPETVKNFRAQLSAVDAVFFSAEEFNYSISGNGAVSISCIYRREAEAQSRRMTAATSYRRCFEERH